VGSFRVFNALLHLSGFDCFHWETKRDRMDRLREQVNEVAGAGDIVFTHSTADGGYAARQAQDDCF
jgi:hypothetical protein